jgi:pimeloyl-ACP methyl ester carboxylesterase
MELPRRPQDVPDAVDDALLAAVLADGRPPLAVGSAPETILYVHGLGHDAWDFGRMVERHNSESQLSARVMDMPGFGPPLLDKPATPVTMAMLVDAVVQAARACPRPPVICASSLGGHVALFAAMQHPGVFAGLSLLAPGGLVEVPSATQAVLRAYYSVDGIMGRKDDEIVRNSRRIFVRPQAVSEALATRKLCWHRSSRAMKERFAVPFSSIVGDVFGCYLGGSIHQLQGVPMQVIFGEGDVVVPLSSGRLLERACGARLHILRGVGHTPHLEDPDTTWRLVSDFARAAFAGTPIPAATPSDASTDASADVPTATVSTNGPDAAGGV